MNIESTLSAAIKEAEAQNTDLLQQLSTVKANIKKLDSAIAHVRRALSGCGSMLHALKGINPKSDWAGKRRKEFRRSLDDGGSAAQAGADYRRKLEVLKEQLNSERKRLASRQAHLECAIADNSKLIKHNRDTLASGAYGEGKQ